MSEIITVFKSRTQTLLFAKALRAKKIPYRIVNTPARAGVGCGISVSVSHFYENPLRETLRQGVYPSFVGFFRS
ncbi:MAG: DUF3343 domain-containing protein [Clostridia bacterium]|nr:DUF3343 domain-containing protein [Clostridia bacterium]